MKQFRKLTAVLLTLMMVLAYIPFTVSAAETGTIEGDTQLYAPPVGKYSKVEYILKDAEGNVVPDAKLVMAYAHAGVRAEGNCLILDGTNIKSGTFRMHAESQDGSIVSADITPKVYANRIYLDIENGTVDSKVQECGAGKPLVLDTGIVNTEASSIFQDTNYSSSVKAEANGNKYIFGDDGIYTRLKPSWLGLGGANASTYVIQADLQKHGQWAAAQYWNIFSYTGNTIKYDYKNSDNYYEIVNTYDKDGNALSEADYERSGKKLNSVWQTYCLKLDFRNKTYSVYLDGEALWENYKMKSDAVITYPELDIYMKLDNFAIYSGEPYVPETPYEVEGTSTIYLPTGKAASVPFVLKNKEDGTVVEDAVYSVSGSGLEMLSDGTLVVNGSTPAGTYVVSAYSPSNEYGLVATKTVTIKDTKWYYDFEDRTVGGLPLEEGSANNITVPGKINPVWNSRGVINAEYDENNPETVINKYFGYNEEQRCGDTDGKLHNVYPKGHFTGKATVEYDFLIDEQNDKWHYILRGNSTAGLSMQITYTDAKVLSSSYNAVGGATAVYTNYQLENGWHHIRAEFGYDTYSVWIDGNLFLDSFKYKDGTKGYLDRLWWGADVDNLMIYDGSEYTLKASAEVSNLEIPGAGSKSYTLSSVYSDGKAVTKELAYTLADSYEGVSIDGNTITFTNAAALAPVVINVTDGFVNGSGKLQTMKDYVTVNGAVYEAGTDVINADGTYTIKAEYGFSNQHFARNLYIAQYEGGKLVKVAVAKDGTYPLSLSATLSESFTANGKAKVFIWGSNDMTPFREVKEID